MHQPQHGAPVECGAWVASNNLFVSYSKPQKLKNSVRFGVHPTFCVGEGVCRAGNLLMCGWQLRSFAAGISQNGVGDGTKALHGADRDRLMGGCVQWRF